MIDRRSEFDVTDRIKTTDSVAVGDEVQRIFCELYPGRTSPVLQQSFADVARLYRGEWPGHLACDTGYHNLQHVLDVTLAMSRLMAGYEHARSGSGSLGERLFELGVITALFHDCGYIRKAGEADVASGAAFTTVHVSRGALFLEDYLRHIGRGREAPIAAQLIHFTGYEIPADQIKVPSPTYRLLGNLLGSADIIAQMADRCYLEKCRDMLFPEFVAGGITRKRNDDGSIETVFSSAEDLVYKTPAFYATALKRLNELLGGVYAFAEPHFGGQNLYLEEVSRNIRYAERVSRERDVSLLRRVPPVPEPAPEAAAVSRAAGGANRA